MIDRGGEVSRSTERIRGGHSLVQSPKEKSFCLGTDFMRRRIHAKPARTQEFMLEAVEKGATASPRISLRRRNSLA